MTTAVTLPLVKDVLSILRLAENPRDSTSAMRTLQLMDGFGSAHAKRAIAQGTRVALAL